MSVSNLLQEVPTVVPCYSTNGSSFVQNQQVEFEVPSSILTFIPAESYISMDVKFPDVSDTTTLANYIPPQFWGSAGVHGLVRDIVVYSMATGQEVDRINYYSEASKMLPFHLSENDSTAYLAQQEGLGLWKASCFQGGAPIALNQNLNSVDPFDLSYFHQTDANNNVISVVQAGVVGTRSRIVRYSVPIRWGFMSSPDEYVNFHGLRVVITLNPAIDCLDYTVCIAGNQRGLFQNSGATLPPSLENIAQSNITLGNTTILLENATPTNLDKSILLPIANQHPCGSVITLTQGVNSQTFTIRGYAISGNNIQMTLSSAIAGPLVNGQAVVSFPRPTTRNNLSYTVQNPILYVRQLNTDPSVIQARLEELKKNPDAMVYSFRTLYNYPLSINASVSNPVLNFNAVALKHAQGMAFVFRNESDNSNINSNAPGRLCSLLLSSTSAYPSTPANIRQYQIKLGNRLLINQPVSIDNLVPQVLNKEVANFLEVACGKKFCNAEYHSIDNQFSYATQTKADILQYYNRVIATALVNNSDSAMDITNMNIQVLLFTPSGADPSSYTCNMFVSHFKHLMLTPNGVMIEE